MKALKLREVSELGAERREAVRSRRKSRLLPADHEVMSAEIAMGNFSQVNKYG
jgi:hypothetical protein